ncbi:MAG: DUF3365 domain-containing protein [Desulfobulbaceae bacterium]|nr:DUF3365 domain-containing protein [Desulfobulbaceae bacterium]
MRLRNKFILLIGLVVIVSYGITFYRTSSFQQQLVFDQTVRQARMLHKQILLTRKWVADHHGVFLLKAPGVESSKFLLDAQVVDVKGRKFVKRNPAMVTRELSAYAQREGVSSFRVTSLKPLNPDNAPDDFERDSLLLFQNEGVPEVSKIQSGASGKILRYIAPLVVEDSCLDCHKEQGYVIGDIRGGLSITIPVDWAFESISSNNKLLFGIGVGTIVLVAITISMMFEFLVGRRLGMLSMVMERYPEVGEVEALPTGDDEVGQLAEKFKDLCHRLTVSQSQLDKAREQVFQNEKLVALGRLTAGIAHEINNPLGGMQNCVKSMREDPDDHEMAQRYLDLLDKGLRRIGRTVRQLLNFGRREPLKLRRLDVDELVRDCFALIEHSLKGVELRLDLNLQKKYLVDGEALKQVVVNIGLNAVHSMPGGGVLSVHTEATDSSILLSFSDTGCGIETENLDKIFDPFFTTKEVGEGTGLGLSISYSLVQRMKGIITVDSDLAHGTTFVIKLPQDTMLEE